VVGVSVRSVSVRLRLATLAGEVLHAARVDRVQGPAEDLVAQLRSLVVAASGSHAAGRPVAAVVVGISGAWDAARARVLAAPNLPTLEGVDLGAALQAGLGDLVPGGSVALDNDVNLAALGEQARGAARGVSDFYYVSLGSGVGGAAVLEGRLRRGAHGLTGELGYLPVGPAGASVPLESVIGRKPLEQWVRERRRAAAPTAASAAAARSGGTSQRAHVRRPCRLYRRGLPRPGPGTRRRLRAPGLGRRGVLRARRRPRRRRAGRSEGGARPRADRPRRRHESPRRRLDGA